MFDIKESLNKWKQDLNHNQSLNISDVNELQLHLEDSMEELEEKGLSEEEAFWIARHRIGDTEVLSNEYAKVNRADIWKKRILWFISGYFLIVSFSTITNLCFYGLHFMNTPWTIKTSFSKLEVTFPILFYILIFIFTAGILFLLTSRKNIKGKNIVNRLCSPIEKKKYRFIMILLGLYIFTSVGLSLFTATFVRIYEPATFGSIKISITMFSILRTIFLVLLAGIFTFQLSRKEKKYKVV